MSSINGISRLGGAVLPAAGAALGGTAITAPSTGHGVAQHAALSAHPPRGGSNGTTALRVELGKISQDIMNRMSGASMAKTVEGFHQVPKSAVLQGTYSLEVRSRAMGAVVNGLARLKQDFPGMA